MRYMIFCANSTLAQLAERYLLMLRFNRKNNSSVVSFISDNELVEEIPLSICVDTQSNNFYIEYCQPTFIQCVKHNNEQYRVLNFEHCINVKQVIVWRKDLKVRLGKKMAQAAHASMAPILHMMELDGGADGNSVAWIIEDEELFSPFTMYKLGAFKKIVVSVDNEEELIQLYNRIKQHSHHFHNEKLPVALITDSGLTEFNGIPTNTCIGIGPFYSSVIDVYTKDLSLL